MTMPSERTRALRWAGEFLREIMASDAATPEMKNQANVILRHYPSEVEIKSQAEIIDKKDNFNPWMPWMQPE